MLSAKNDLDAAKTDFEMRLDSEKRLAAAEMTDAEARVEAALAAAAAAKAEVLAKEKEPCAPA